MYSLQCRFSAAHGEKSEDQFLESRLIRCMSDLSMLSQFHNVNTRDPGEPNNVDMLQNELLIAG
jgi:hypothetical protein